MLPITFASQNCNNYETASQSVYLTKQHIFEFEDELQESLDCYTESLNNLFESYSDVVSNNTENDFLYSSLDKRNKFMLDEQILRDCINRCFISFYFIGYQNCRPGIFLGFCVKIMLLFILVAYFWLFYLKCKAFHYFVSTFIFFLTFVELLHYSGYWIFWIRFSSISLNTFSF